jgi:uncharacterized SAM-binding protein YcdF (DUF218 family)
MNSPHDVICFSSIDWDFVRQGHQVIMEALVRQGHRVLFIENTGVRNPRLSDLPRIWHRLASWRKSLRGFRREGDNLYIFSPLVLPFPYSRLGQWINRRLMLSALKRWMDVMDFHRPICWTFLPSPLTLEVIRRIPHQALVYYCIDSFVNSTSGARRIEASERTLFQMADLVFVTSSRLYGRAAQWNRRVHLFPFGVEMDVFQRAEDAGITVPEELRRLSRPIIGYVGGVHQWVDQELLCRIAQAHPDYSFVLVGPAQTDVERLRQQPNIVLLGQRPHSELPSYVKHFDVGLIPYRLTEYTKNVYPTKLNEYHVMGKPVVSTPLPEILAFNRQHHDLVTIGSASEFDSALERALHGDSQQLKTQRIEAARDNGWGRRIASMEALIAQVAAAKAAPMPENWAERFLASLRTSQALWRSIAGAVFLLMVIFYTPVMWFIAEPLKIVDAPRPTDAIVVFAGGVGDSGEAGEGYRERAQQAVELFKHGYAPRILFVSGYTYTFQEAEIMRLVTQSLGVPASAIMTETDVSNTHDYVSHVGIRAERDRWRSILLVTSPYHTRRAALTFARNFPKLQVLPVPAPSSYYAHSWGIAPHQIHGILHEYAGILYYWWKGWM